MLICLSHLHTLSLLHIQTNCLARNINQLRRKLTDSHKSLAKRLKKLVKAWQQLIKKQTPNGLTTPSLGSAPGNGGGAGANKTVEHTLPSDLQQKPNLVASARRQSIGSSREGTPLEESLASKAGKQSHSKKYAASRTPTPTPSPHPLPSSSTSSVSASSSAPPPLQQPPVVPRQTKAQDFARNRIRRMQMFSAVKKPNMGQMSSQSHQLPAPSSSSSTATTAPSLEEQSKEQLPLETGMAAITAGSQSQPPRQTALPPVSMSLSSLSKPSSFLFHSEPSFISSSPISNGSHSHVTLSQSPSLLSSSSSTVVSPPTNSSQSMAHVNLSNSHSRHTTSLSQIITNSLNHEPTTLTEMSVVPSAPQPSSVQTSIAHKIGVKGSRGEDSHRIPDMPLPDSLVVRIPRSNVQVRSLLNDTRINDCSHKNNLSSDSLRSTQRAGDELSMIVSIDLSLLLRGKGRPVTTSLPLNSAPEIRPSRTEQQLSTESRHGATPCSFFAVKSEPVDLHVKNNQQQHAVVMENEVAMETESTPLFGKRELTFNEPRPIPLGAYPGVDGCLGNNGFWYTWTDIIPGQDEALTVLPYIYIDEESEDCIDFQ